jgi:RecB family exonuclease
VFTRLDAPLQSARERFAASHEELRAVVLAGDHSDPAYHSLQVERTRESAAPADEYDGITRIPLDLQNRHFSPSSLKDIGQCPFRFFVLRVLKLQPPEIVEDGLSPQLKGNFYHLVLELLLKPLLQREITTEEMLAHFDAAFAQAEQEKQLATIRNWPQMRGEEYTKLRNAVSAENFIAPGRQVLAVEADFADVYWRGLRLKGRMDRLDGDAASVHVIDYKSGSSTQKVQDRFGQLKLDLQLAIYLEAGIPKLYPESANNTARYYFLAKCDDEPAKWDEQSLEEFIVRVQEYCEQGKFPVLPDHKKEACTYCECRSMCRVSSRIDRKGGNR